MSRSSVMMLHKYFISMRAWFSTSISSPSSNTLRSSICHCNARNVERDASSCGFKIGTLLLVIAFITSTSALYAGSVLGSMFSVIFGLSLVSEIE